MSPALLPLLLSSFLATPLGDGAIEFRYNGSFDKVSREGEGAVKRFSLYCLLTKAEEGRQLAFALDERGGGSWAWPERYGLKDLDAQLNLKSPALRLMLDHNGTPTLIPLPCPIFAGWDKLKMGASWTEGKETWEVTGTQQVVDRKCWTVEVTTPIGRKRTLWVDQQLPVVVALEEKVFVGQGEEHALKMQLNSQKTLTGDELAAVNKPLQPLLALQTTLKRPENETRSELTDDQIAAMAKAVPELEKLSADTPFSALVTVIARDLKSQKSRTGEITKLAKKFIGQPAPAFSITTLDKQTIDAEARKDKITILHFWEYQNEPLVEPYGQSGYLDHLYSRRRKLGVEIIGVAVDPKLSEPATATAAARSTQRFKTFMNLSYPVATDNGALIGKFGDPRKAGAKLPLWVVIGPDGKILHYSVGFFKVNPDEGLRELDELLVETIKASRANKPK